MKRVIFLDRDGTVIRNYPYNGDPLKIEFQYGSIDVLKKLYDDDSCLVVITNQSGVARGYISEDDVIRVNDRMATLARNAEVDFATILYCPHHPDGSVERYSIHCECRKPGTKLLEVAVETLGIDNVVPRYFIGDSPSDMWAGFKFGCVPILYDPCLEADMSALPSGTIQVATWMGIYHLIMNT